MRPQASPIQEPGDQKKSVFDRLGRQLDAGRPMNRGSPGQYGEHPMHQVMHEADFGRFGRFGRPDQHPDMNWRYQNDRRHMPLGRERHQHPVAPFPPHFDMNMQPGRQPAPYYPGPHPQQPPYHTSPGGPPPMVGPDVLSMGMHQRRPSPKYDRHGNPIRGPMRMDHPPGMSPPRNFMGPPMPGPMMHPAGYDMVPMNPGMYPQNRWHENLDMGPPMHGRLAQDERFLEAQRFQQQQQQQQQQPQPLKGPMMIGPEHAGHQANFEAPRYSKWRERRDAITNLDRQTAQSSSKTDSLKSSLQQPETRNQSRRNHARENRQRKNEQRKSEQANQKKEQNNSAKAEKPKQQAAAPPKYDPSEISDGEIIDDEDSSDESDSQKAPQGKDASDRPLDQSSLMIHKTPFGRVTTEGQQYANAYDGKKRRRLQDRDDYPMDYETISDEELEDFMSDKKLVDDRNLDGSADGKSSSEIELLNALGLDWANLIELSRQSRKEAPTSGSALRRFSLPYYLPTLGITRELAGPEIYDFILKVCH